MKKSLILIILIFILSIFSSCNNNTSIKDNDSTLSKILINDEEIDNFDKYTLSYEITIPYIKEIRVEGIPTSNKAVVDGNNAIVVDEDKNIYSITLTCIAEDQSKTNYYISINVLNEEKSSNCDLESLMIDDILIDGFNKDILNYDIYLDEEREVNITAVLADEKASVTNIGKYNINESKTINIIVTAEDGTTKTYNLNFIIDDITKPTLENILIDDVPLTDFKEDKYVYIFSATTTKVKVSAVYNSNYKVTGEGVYEIAKGKVTLIPLIVKNGSLETKYVINVNGPKLDDDATLKELKINDDSISLVKDKYEYSYDLYDKKEFNISAVANSNLAKIGGVGSFTLNSNSDTFNITVTAEDKTTLTYKITINYKESTANLEIKYCEGLNETIAIEYIGSSNLNISYKEENDSTYKDVDKELIRNMGSYVRVDIVGLKAGNYNVKIANITKNNITVYPYDRSGYAFFNYDDGIGAYNNDGTLKDNALVIYVSDATKNSVIAKIDNKEYKGLVDILQNARKSKVPIVIRVLDTIKAATWNTITYDDYSKDNPLPADEVLGINGKPLLDLLDGDRIYGDEIISKGYNSMSNDINNGITELEGLTNRINYDVKKNELDSYYNMLDVSDVNNLTIEGIGTNAGIYQFGFTWSKCSSIEVRNLTFADNPEDACAFQGASVGSGVVNVDDQIAGFDSYNIWIHNNTFNEGKNNWDVCYEQDKHEGDGSTDLKWVSYVTISNNHYYKNHKTGLVGGGSSHLTYNVTFHHNYYEDCKARLPLARQANMHIYNNYYYGITDTCLSLRANAYALVEGCYFENCNRPIEYKEEAGSTGIAKVFNCEFIDCTKDNSGQKVNNRDEIVNNTNIYGNFDTNSELFYYKNGMSDVMILTDASKAKEDCINYAGVLKKGQNSTIFS